MLVILLKINAYFLLCATTPHGYPLYNATTPYGTPMYTPLYRRPPPMDPPLYTPLYIFLHRTQWSTTPLSVRTP